MAKKTPPKKTTTAPISKTKTTGKAEAPKNKKSGIGGLPPNVLLIIILACVAIAGYVVYFPSLSSDFTNWDDPGYLTQNYEIRDWTKNGINHLFSSYTMGNYHPLTMLSFAWEYHTAALKPYIYHRDSMLLHIFTCLAVTFFTWLITRNFSITAICGILFAIHPMHVESVAWIAGRKDVMYGLFYFLALIAYYYYYSSKKNKILFYGMCMIMFALSLLSKGVAVTLPISCLLVDYYLKRPLKIRLLIEKIPLFILSIIFGIISIKSQQSVEAIQSDTVFPVVDRVFFASYAFLAYISKFLLPWDLCNFYPYPVQTNGHFTTIWYLYPVMLAALLLIVFLFARKNRGVMFGFLFYTTAIFLLLQLLPVGTAIIADRYSYIAYFGLFFIIGYLYYKAMLGVPAWLKTIRPVFPIILLGWFIYLGMTTRARCEVWKNTESLWRDAIEKQPTLSTAYNNLGYELYNKEAKYDEALPYFTKAIELLPTFELPYMNRGEIYRIQGKNQLAQIDFNKAISLKPNDAKPYLSRAILYCIKGKLDSAGADFDKCISIDPNMAEAYSSRGNYYDMRGKFDSSIADYNKAISLKPDIPDAYMNRGEAFIRHKDFDAGIADLNTYLQLKPESGEVYMKRSSAYLDRKEYKNALQDALQAKTLGFTVDANYIENLKKLTGQP